MSNPNSRKSCVVPKCKNTTTNSPAKLFFIVPKDVNKRKKWIKAMKRLNPFGDKSTVYCCEDHFDIENDMENYIKYKLVGGRIKLKQGIVPHKFKCQQEKVDKPKRSALQKHNRIEYFEILLNNDETSTLEKPIIVSCEDKIIIEDPLSFGNSHQCLEISKKSHPPREPNVEDAEYLDSSCADGGSADDGVWLDVGDSSNDTPEKEYSEDVTTTETSDNTTIFTPIIVTPSTFIGIIKNNVEEVVKQSLANVTEKPCRDDKSVNTESITLTDKKVVPKPIIVKHSTSKGLCRCCGTMKKCRVLNIEYYSLGQKEVYSDMIMDCYGLLMSYLDGTPSDRLICATCVTRIRDALNFRRQVLKCEEAFLKMKEYENTTESSTSTGTKTIKSHHIDTTVVKTERMSVDNHSDDGDALADTPDYDQKPELSQDSNSNDDLPLKPKVSDTFKTKSVNVLKKKGAASLARQILITRKRLAEKLRQKAKWQAMRQQYIMSGKRPPRESPLKNELQMSKLQQQVRENDPSYKRESNILTTIEYSYVCPFKCRHNHLLCYYCGEVFSDPVLLREHTLTSHNPRKFKITEQRNIMKIDLTRIDCRLCREKIDSLDDFRHHITSVHNKKYYFDVKDSVLPFKLTRENLKCALCDNVYPYFHALNKHMNEHFRNYVCETCGLGFVDSARLAMHQQRHEQGEFPCGTCGKIFKAQFNRDLHIDRVHRKMGRVYCPKCDIKLMSYPQKLKHLVEVHGEEPLSFRCETCDKVFDSRRTLTLHKRKEHLKDYRYVCQCGQKFFTRFALNNHMPTHTGERNFKCKVCEKTYPRLKTLKDHMRIHTNDRRYRCHVCGQAFIQNCSLKGHMKSQHPEYG